jgi:hypothetical protein
MTHRINLSAGWVPDGERWVRRFGRPTGADGARLVLVGAGAGWLNGEPLTLPADVTGKLLARNELVLTRRAPGAVALEIHPPAPAESEPPKAHG